jgi:exonuclease III
MSTPTTGLDITTQAEQQNKNRRTGNEIWGDKISKNKNKLIRITFQNIRGFGTTKDSVQSESIREFIEEYNIDIYMMAEVNVNWRIVGKRNSIWDISRRWFERQKVSAAYNQRDRSCNKYQPGGTAIISRDEVSLRAINIGQDLKRLGRWTWTLFKGKDEKRTRVVSVYVPCLAQTFGCRKVYCQQQKALLHMGCNESVIQVFWNDFWEQIDTWRESGDQLIIGGDWNTDVRNENFLRQFRSRNLIASITDRHGPKGPETYSGGSKPIDEIFCSSSLRVMSAGYLAHGQATGDHRPIWIDITKASALGTNMKNLPTYNARRLKCQDPRVVARYNKVFEDFLTKHGVYNRIYELYHNFNIPLNEFQKTEYEKLDRLREKGMMMAEKKCRKLKMGRLKWSPILQQARVTILYYKLCLSKKKKKKISTRYLTRLSNSIKIDATHLSQAQIQITINESYDKYKQLKLQHTELRRSFLEDKASALEADGKGPKSTIIRNLIRIEDQKAMYSKLGRITKKKENLQITSIKVKRNGVSKELSSKEDVEDAIIQENKSKYHQTENYCPFLEEPLLSDFGQYGEGKGTEQVLNGTYECHESIDEYTRDYLRLCKRTNSLTNQERSTEDFKTSWKKIDEKTSSRHLHFGHFKAACSNELNILVHYVLAEIPFRSGYSPKRWQTATNVMILKKSGVFDVNKLRTIVLFEADFNQNNKHFGRSMMKHTVSQGSIATEQYSVPGKKCIDHVVNRRLIFDIVRYQKSSFAMTSCDLKSCYDRVAHSPAALAMKSYGISSYPIESMFSTIQDIEYVTRTVFGDSNKRFGGQEEFSAKPQGLGQGNGAGPSTWSVVSSKMFEVLHSRNCATSFTSPMSKNTTKICGFAFVDDSDIIASSGNNNTPIHTLRKMQTAIDCWQGVAKTTGGALEPSKSWWYLIHFTWDKGKWEYGNTDTIVEDIVLTAEDKDNNRTELKYLEASEAQQMLGVYLSPNGSNDTQFKAMLEKTKHYGEMIRTGHIYKHEAWIALTTIATKSLEYAVPALTLTKEQYKKIMWPLLQSILPRAGVNRNIHRSILYGPIERQGLGARDPYLLQGIYHVRDMQEHLWKNTSTGKFHKINLEQLRLEIGSNADILRTNYKRFEDVILTPSLIQDTWRFMSEHQITMIYNIQTFPLPCAEDKVLMDEFLTATIPKSELKTINRCRIYLKVLTLSDIVTGDGKYITNDAFIGRRRNRQSSHSYHWPNWDQPAVKDWRIWRKALKLVFAPRWHRKLSHPVGSWTRPIPTDWEWYESIEGDEKLYQLKDDNTWMAYNKLGRSKRVRRYRLAGSIMITPPTMNDTILQTTVILRSNCIESEGTRDRFPVHIDSEEEQNTPTWLHYNMTQSNSIATLVTDICTGKARAVSDGSYYPETGVGTAAWTIESKNEQEYITGISIVPGPPSIQSAYRSELTGILAILEKLRTLCTNHSITSGQITIYCDGISALTQSLSSNYISQSPNFLHSDILSTSTKILHNLPIKVRSIYVKAHQDDEKQFHQLDRPAQLNTKMDLLAKETATSQHTNYQIDYNSHYMSFPPIMYKNLPIQHKTIDRLYFLLSSEKIMQYWKDKGRITETSYNLIHWDAIGKAMKSMTQTQRRFNTKWASNNMGTGNKMVQWRYRHKGNCPYCMAPNEDVTHLLECTDTQAVRLWNESLWDYITGLHKLHTSIKAIVAIMKELQSWRENLPLPDIDSLDRSLRAAITNQRLIGWRQFLEGLLAQDWIDFQQQHYLEINSKKTGLTWSTKIIKLHTNFLQQIWTGRNNQLHKTQIIQDLEGLPELLQSIRTEWNTGISTLPAVDFSHLFSLGLDNLLRKSVNAQKDWLAVVKLGRLLHQDPNINIDGFSTKGPLSRWIGISDDEWADNSS